MSTGSTLPGYAFLLGYVVLVVLLSRVFLGEPLSWLKIAGILLTVAGVALLSLEES
jgi:drug/metabolite transporter (DMT)-like permease